MCTYSMIAEHKIWEWEQRRPLQPFALPEPRITQAEVEEFRRLLERAREYDRTHGEPNCELEEKKEKLRALAKELGVEVVIP